jgi:hypothetical protein
LAACLSVGSEFAARSLLDIFPLCARRRKRKMRGAFQTLYIQMEYCEKTLSDVIQEGTLPAAPDR